MLKSFKHALNGLSWSAQNQKNFVLHISISIAVFLLAYILQVSRTDFIILVFAVVLGLTAEMMNTSIEEMTDLITIKWSKQAKIAKDVAAGMMLIVSLGTAIVGLIVFIPYILQQYQEQILSALILTAI